MEHTKALNKHKWESSLKLVMKLLMAGKMVWGRTWPRKMNKRKKTKIVLGQVQQKGTEDVRRTPRASGWIWAILICQLGDLWWNWWMSAEVQLPLFRYQLKSDTNTVYGPINPSWNIRGHIFDNCRGVVPLFKSSNNQNSFIKVLIHMFLLPLIGDLLIFFKTMSSNRSHKSVCR